jgi:hypothetical protein
MVGFDYMNMPMEIEHHGYGAMVSMGLPWLNPGRSAMVRAAEQSRQSAARFLEAAANQARLELRAAAGRWRAGRYRLALADRNLLPQARQSFEVTRTATRAGRAISRRCLIPSAPISRSGSTGREPWPRSSSRRRSSTAPPSGADRSREMQAACGHDALGRGG